MPLSKVTKRQGKAVAICARGPRPPTTNVPRSNALVTCPSATVSSHLFLDETKTRDFTYLTCQVFLMEALQELGLESRKMTTRTLPARYGLHLKSASERYVNKIYLIATSTSELDSCNIQYLGALHISYELARIFIS